MNTNTLMIFCNLIPALFILFYFIDGWNKGAIYMFVSIIRLIVSYIATRYLSRIMADTLINLPVIRTQIATVAANQEGALTGVPGASQLLTGEVLQSTIEQIGWWLLYAISFAIIFTALMLFFRIVLRVSKWFNKIPILGWFNKFVGACEGLIFGVGITLLFMYFIAFGLNLLGEIEIADALMGSWLPTAFRILFG